MITDFSSLVRLVTNTILDPIVVLIMALAVVYFLIGVFKYLRSAGDETERKNGTVMMTYGIVALFVMVSFWGLVNVLEKTFPLRNKPLRPPSIGGSVVGGNVGLPGGPAEPPSDFSDEEIDSTLFR